MKPVSLLFLALSALAVLTSCSSTPSWLEGDWYFDKNRTLQEMNSKAPTPDQGMAAGLGSMLVAMLIPQLTGMQLTITNKERMTMVNGQGHSDRYQVLESSADKCTLKIKDGTVETYYRSENSIYTYSTGSAAVKIYYKRQL